MGVKAELVKLIVDKTMSTLSEDTGKQAADFLFQHLYIRNEKGMAKQVGFYNRGRIRLFGFMP